MSEKPKSITRRKAIGVLGSTGAGVLIGQIAAAAQTAGKNTGKGVQVAGRTVEVQITAVNPRVLRISLLPIVDGKMKQISHSLVLAPTHWPEPAARLRSETNQTVSWGKMKVSVTTAPVGISIETAAGKKLQQFSVDPANAEVRFLLGDSPIYGLGEGGKQFDRRGAMYRMAHGERVRDLKTNGARLSIPWIIGTEGWGLFFHLPLGAFNLSGQEGAFRSRDGYPDIPLDIFFVVADEPAQIMKEYALLTGFPHMPPIWSLGYQQSHRTLDSRHGIMSELETFRDKKLPCDVMIYLGTGFCPSGWNLWHGSYQFNPKVFPDPKEMISQMHKEHFRIVLHEDKPPRELHGRATDTGAAAENPEDAAYYWKLHEPLVRMGVDGWWADEGDWLNVRDCLIRNRMYWQGSIMDRPNVRPYTLNRNGYAGLQRYGWLWSGDIDSKWETLRAQIAVGLNTGLTGLPYWGTDTGGFVTTPELTGELYVRWFQFSAFCPLFRSHGRTWKLRLPWGWDTGSYGPIEGSKSELPPPEDLHNAKVEPICQKYLDLRYQLLPYLYTAIREAHDTGLPIMRALWLHYPDDPLAVERGDEYLFGPSLLVAPVIEKGAKTRTLYLPHGTWYDFWTEEEMEGGREITRDVDLSTIPLYVRAGSILPFGPVKQYTTEKTNGPLSLRVYPGKDGNFSLYDDDGISFNYKKGEYARLLSAWDDQSRRLTVQLLKGAAWPELHRKSLEARLAGTKAVHRASIQTGPKTIQF